MPKWKEGETEFNVGVSFHNKRGYQSSIPKPVIEHLGKHESILQNGITFLIKGKRIEVVHRPKTEKISEDKKD